MPKLTVEHSDADKANWPAGWLDHAVDIKKNENYHEKVDKKHPKHILFCQKIGQHLATVGDMENPVNYELTDLPAGYALFLHHKLQANGSDRTDIYMFGSKQVTKFRSPAEFFGHAEWLQKGDLKDHDTCTCKYSKNSSMTPGAGADAKRKAAPQQGPSKTPQKKIKTSDEEELARYRKKLDQTARERQEEVKSERLYRMGEMVWVKVPTIRPPADSTVNVGISEINYWPAVVIAAGVKVHADEGEQDVIMQSTRYDVQYCGRLDHASGNAANKAGTTVEETDVLPWHLLEPIRPDLTALAKKYALSVAEASIGLTEEGAAEEKRVETWRNGTINKNWPIAEAVKPENWEMMAVVYAQAVVFATEVTALWSQTDPYSHMDKIPFNHDIAADKSYFQGLWWGPERIWIGDLIRLVRPRLSLHRDKLKPLAPGSENRAAFLRLIQISVQQIKRETTSAYHCMIHGDLFELAEADWAAENDPRVGSSSAPAGNGDAAAEAAVVDEKEAEKPAYLPPAPKGLVYRQVNEPHSEVMCDIFDIAGRVYPTLDQLPAAKPAQDGEASTSEVSAEQNKATEDKKTRLEALMGVSPVGEIKTNVKDWKDARFTAMVAAHTASTKWLASVFEGGNTSAP